jgi:hypothetical protein
LSLPASVNIVTLRANLAKSLKIKGEQKEILDEFIMRTGH